MAVVPIPMSQDIQLPDLHPRKSLALIALGMGAYFVYLYHVGFQEVMESLYNVNIFIFSLSFLIALIGVLFDGLAWRKVASKFNYNVSVGDVFHMYMSCIFLNNLIPSGSFSGETARVYFLDKLTFNSRLDQSSATVAATRIITAIPFILGTVVGLYYLIFLAEAPKWALATCSSITLFLLGVNAIFIGICFSNSWLEGIIFKIADHMEGPFHMKVDRNLCTRVVRRFHQSMKKLTVHRRTLAISTFWSFAAWICMNLVAFVTFRSMGVNVPVAAIFAVYAVMIFLQMLPLVLPGGIGLVDIVMITLFNAVGVPMHDAVAATILTRLVQLWFLTALGGISTAYLVRKIDHKSRFIS
jgi:uncharacterized protein (TIRG00374 family)